MFIPRRSEFVGVVRVVVYTESRAESKVLNRLNINVCIAEDSPTLENVASLVVKIADQILAASQKVDIRTGIAAVTGIYCLRWMLCEYLAFDSLIASWLFVLGLRCKVQGFAYFQPVVEEAVFGVISGTERSIVGILESTVLIEEIETE